MSIIRLRPDTDPRSFEGLADYANLTDAALRQASDVAEGRFIAETTLVVERALDAGYRPRSFFLAEKHLPDLEERLTAYPDVPVYVGSPQTLERIAGFHLHRGALAAMWRKPLPSVPHVLDGAQRIAVIEDVVDHTNIGAIIRSAAVLGIDGILLSPRCADPLYRRAIRTSMGTVFSVPIARAQTWPGDLSHLESAGFTTAALALTDSAVRIDDFARTLVSGQRLALFLGSEGPGLSAAVLDAVDHHVVIPMADGVDSLNVAAASAVAFWETRRVIG
jgi:tRNA G18 (ribose-2'-O)-methylase SpoU